MNSYQNEGIIPCVTEMRDLDRSVGRSKWGQNNEVTAGADYDGLAMRERAHSVTLEVDIAFQITHQCICCKFSLPRNADRLERAINVSALARNPCLQVSDVRCMY